MSRYAREGTVRVGAILATGVVAGLPLLVAGPASAATTQISFTRSGGLEALSCNSSPSEASVTVPAESTVTFVNRLGTDATLRIDGRDATEVKSDEAKDVLFHRGPVQVAMVPDCSLLALSKSFETVSVDVVRAGENPAKPPAREPAEPGSQAPGGGSSGGGSSSGSSTGTDESPAARPSAPASPSGSPTAPADGGSSSPAAGTVEGPEAPGGEQGLAAEPLSPVRASSERGPNGLLAIIAVVCVIGVSAGAIRAIVAQRATRTSVA